MDCQLWNHWAAISGLTSGQFIQYTMALTTAPSSHCWQVIKEASKHIGI